MNQICGAPVEIGRPGKPICEASALTESGSENDRLFSKLITLSISHNHFQDLLYRRLRCLANYEAANKNLERARGRNNKDIPKAEAEQQEACKKFEDISALAKTELKDLKKRRVLAFKKNLADLADLEIKHAKVRTLCAQLNSLT
ncbi:hypothetical protein COOONC_02860, partial [Cooperia oncophora]